MKYKLSDHYSIEDKNYYNQLFSLTKTISDSYPGHFTWLNTKFIPGLYIGHRAYSFAIDNNIQTSIQLLNNKEFPIYSLIGCSLLKNTPIEKKICCLFIDKNYRRQGIASKLIQDSFEILQTTKPLITVSEQNLDQLKPLLKKFNFELTSVKDSVYLKGIKEYYYNEGLSR